MFDKNRKKLIAQRLKEQRKKHKLTHIGLANALNEKYGLEISKDSLIQYEVIDEFHAKWDKVKGMKIEYLYYFADFFNVSTDYLLGKDECTTPENEAIKKQLGLSDTAIGQLKTANTKNLKVLQYKKVKMLNYLIENMNSTDLLENLHDYLFETYVFTNKFPDEIPLFEKYRGETFDTTIITTINSNKKRTLRCSLLKNIFYAAIQEDIIKMGSIIAEKDGETE